MEIDCIYKGGKSHNNLLSLWLQREENPMFLWKRTRKYLPVKDRWSHGWEAVGRGLPLLSLDKCHNHVVCLSLWTQTKFMSSVFPFWVSILRSRVASTGFPARFGGAWHIPTRTGHSFSKSSRSQQSPQPLQRERPSVCPYLIFFHAVESGMR